MSVALEALLKRAEGLEAPAIFFCGIGGSGMSALAQVLRHRGLAVAGSDRSHDRGENAELFDQLAAQGIVLQPQDGSGVGPGTACVVASTAVEAAIPDLQAARERGVPLVHRADLLAELLNAGGTGIAIGGTSGKSTVTGMVGHVFRSLGADPCVINGGIMVNARTHPYLGNAVCGTGRLIAEVDESDGTILKYWPRIGVVTSISEDHKPLPEIRALFEQFARQTAGPLIYHGGCPECRALLAPRSGSVSFAVEQPADWQGTDLRAEGLNMRFRLRGETFYLAMPGRHNVQNALAAIAVADAAGLDWRAAGAALADFRGIHRRFEHIGTAHGLGVYDDFAHNPEKIAAALQAATCAFERVLAVFQPHGYGPTRFLRAGLVQAFAGGLRPQDQLVLLPIYDAGGSADRSIASADLVADLAALGRHATALGARSDLPAYAASQVGCVDALLLMGARDPGLADLAHSVFEAVRSAR